MDLSDVEIRVLACLLEKQRTTPDHYPLSLNSLRLACNQATNREPVVDYDDAVIREALHRLNHRGYIRLASGRSSRTAKYRHLLSEALPMSDDEQAVMCVLMLRGPQTPGELKQRSERIHSFAGLDAVHETLAGLIGRGLVAQLDRRPGQKEERYAQQLGESDPSQERPEASAPRHISGEGTVSTPAQLGPGLSERVERLEGEVAELRVELAALRDRVGAPSQPTFEHDSGDESLTDDEPVARDGPLAREASGIESDLSDGIAQPTP